MSAERLREAARLMRERAEAATTGPWEAWSGKHAGGGEYITATSTVGNYTFGISPGLGGVAGWQVAERDAQHIASWHPAVALAVADWLEQQADVHEASVANRAPADHRIPTRALAVADAYLGSAS